MNRVIVFVFSVLFPFVVLASEGLYKSEGVDLVKSEKLFFPVFGKAGTLNLRNKGEGSSLEYFGSVGYSGKNSISVKFHGFSEGLVCPKLSYSQNGGEINENIVDIYRSRINKKSGDLSCTYQIPVVMDYSFLGEGFPNRDLKAYFTFSIDKDGVASSVSRYSMGMTLASKVIVDGVSHDIVLQDMNGNALIDQDNDYWVVRRSDIDSPIDYKNTRNLSDYVWSDGVAYKALLSDAYPMSVSLQVFDPGVTEEEDAIRRDRYRADRMSPKARKPLDFSHDAHEAITAARESGKPYFVDFETSWCGPCKQMDSLVYTAKSVVDAADGIVCIKVDGDEEEDLVAEMGVESYPTGILFDGNGNEVNRFNGYQSVNDMVEFFGVLKHK